MVSKLKGDKKMNTDKIYAEAVANEYSVKKTTKVVQLKKLDRKAKLPARLFGWIFGSLSTLILGLGMSLVMETLGTGLSFIISGSILGVIGIIGMIINYPIYKKIMKKNKEKYAGDIISIAKEITEEENN